MGNVQVPTPSIRAGASDNCWRGTQVAGNGNNQIGSHHSITGLPVAPGVGMYGKSGNGMFESYAHTGYAPANPYGGYSYPAGINTPGTDPCRPQGPLAPATANVVPVNYAYGGYGGYGNNTSGNAFGTSGGYGFPYAGIGYGYGNYQANAPGPNLGSFGGANPYNWNGDGAVGPYGWGQGGYAVNQGTDMSMGPGYYPGAMGASPMGASPYGLQQPGYTGMAGAAGMNDGSYLTASKQPTTTVGGSNTYFR